MYCIGIAGGTGSGKTTLARAMAARLGDRAALIAHDWYYRDLGCLPLLVRAQQNFDHPDALETSLLVEQLHRLRRGESVDAPQYDFVQHTRSAATLRLNPRPIVIVEGVLALSDPALTGEYDLRVYVEASAAVRFARRIERDLAERGRTREEILRQWETQVCPMHAAHVEPARASAQVVVSGEGDLEVAVQRVVAQIAS